MKYCNNCGKEIKEGNDFCEKCGNRVNGLKTVKSQDKGTAGLVLGIIALVISFSFIGAPIAIILAIVGLILTIANKNKSGNRTAALVLNIVALILSFIITFAFVMIIIFAATASDYDYYDYDYDYDSKFSDIEDGIDRSIEKHKTNIEEAVGTWNCKTFNDSSEYKATVILNSDRTFTFGKYGDLENNYVKGTYEFDDADDVRSTFSLYLELDGKEIVENGEKKLNRDDIDYDMVITNISSNSRGVITNDDTGAVYYCNK